MAQANQKAGPLQQKQNNIDQKFEMKTVGTQDGKLS